MAVDRYPLALTSRPWHLLLIGVLAPIPAASCDPPSGQADASSPDRLPVCQESCSTSSDCLTGYECSAVARCVQAGAASESCSDDDDCLRQVSGWTTPCNDAGVCSRAACVPVGSGRYCAAVPSTSTSCAQLQLQEVALSGLDGGAITVCGRLGYRCQDGRCSKPCAADGDCLSPQQPLCNRTRGRCECQAIPTDSCQSNPAGGRRCRAGLCGCDSDLHCTAPGFDSCLQGQCGCSSPAICAAIERTHPSTRWVCAAQPTP